MCWPFQPRFPPLPQTDLHDVISWNETQFIILEGMQALSAEDFNLNLNSSVNLVVLWILGNLLKFS